MLSRERNLASQTFDALKSDRPSFSAIFETLVLNEGAEIGTF